MWDILLLLPVDPAQYLANLSCKFFREEWFLQEIPAVQVVRALLHYFLGIPGDKEKTFSREADDRSGSGEPFQLVLPARSKRAKCCWNRNWVPLLLSSVR